ncbi:YczE/YyaS/YitT family protein [Clostridium thermarum]|uniref:YczE/YyaS/YitT family protein n=1 Tax=Clostridium thermarum TaxID=1716543 RepID=UPI0011237A0D|nr:hypothetical protein [Clostridium thermarum]
MNKTINIIKRIVLFFVGLFIIQIGVALYLETNIGSDPFTVFAQGLATCLKITPGQANLIILPVFFGIVLFTARKRINIGTIICVLGVGPFIDLGVKIVSVFPLSSYSMVVKILLVALGCIIIAIGFSILSASNLGVGPNDIIPFVIMDKTKFQYRWIRMTFDMTYLIIGLALGGVVGVGTIIAVLMLGPSIQFFLPHGVKLAKAINILE